MPTTRSSKQPVEAFQTLETPKRGRKTAKPCNHDTSPPSPIPVRTYQASTRATQTSPSLAPMRPTYASVGTQMESVHLLTSVPIATMDDRATTTSQKKRSRDDEIDDEPRSKRMMFTPQPNPDRTLWMFPAVDAPRTAPAKSATSAHRPRGHISRTPRYRKPQHTSISNRSSSRPDQISPIDVEESEETSNNEKGAGNHHPGNNEQTQTPARPVSRSIFGSIRGLAATGLQYAMNLSPRRHTSQGSHENSNEPESSRRPPMSDDQGNVERRGGPRIPALSPTTSEEDGDLEINKRSSEQSQHTTGPSSRYDHLHHIPMSGEASRHPDSGNLMSSSQSSAPGDIYESLKQNHPEATEGWLRRMAEQKKRRLEETTGINPDGPLPTTAPLFGPDSHYSRGTIDPAWLRPEPWRDSIQRKEEDEQRQNKRKLDDIESNALLSDQGQLAQEDGADNAFGRASNIPNDDGPQTPLAKKQKTIQPATPRSALRKPTDYGASLGRSGGRSVLFNDNPVSGSRGLRAHYGPAGQYRGSTFADKSPPARNEDSTLSSFDADDASLLSAEKITFSNSPGFYNSMVQLEKNLGADIPHIDFTLRDPNNPDWRPSVTNPRPGSFRVPYVDEEDEDMADVHTEENNMESTPAQPSTPRMSHAELPTPSAAAQSENRLLNDNNNAFESTEQAIEKARSQAQKYKPKDSSRLSSVSQAISRSPSPEAEAVETDSNGMAATTSKTTAPAVRPPGTPPQPFVEPELDNTQRRADDGLTDYEREHQYDEWAANLDWPEPQTYEEAGTGTKQIQDLIRKNWSSEDSRRSSEFWTREFEELELAMQDARNKGLRLDLITGMEDAYEGSAMIAQPVF